MPKMLPVAITTMNSQLEFEAKDKSLGGQLISQVCTSLGIREHWYFGLQYTDSNGKVTWVKENRKVPTDHQSKDLPFKFAFKVKYYPEEVSEELIEDSTRLYFYYDVKDAIVSGSIYCPADTALLLASYQAYIRYGKYDSTAHKPGLIEAKMYLSDAIRDQYNMNDEQWVERIVQCYSSYDYMLKEDVILEYLKIAQDLEMFGVTYFPVKNVRNTDLWLGIDSTGLMFYSVENKLTPKVSFPWNEIHQLSYSRKRLYIKPVDMKKKSLVYTDSSASSKLILNLSTGYHELFAMRRRPDTIEIQQMKIKAKELKSQREYNRIRLNAEIEARELAEKRLREMESTIEDNEKAVMRSRTVLDQYEEKISDLHAQLEAEKNARKQLEDLQHNLEDINSRLEKETIHSLDERQLIASERDAIRNEIDEQRRKLELYEMEKGNLESELQRLRSEQEEKKQMNGNHVEDSAELEFDAVDVTRDKMKQSRVDTDVSHAQRLKCLRDDLGALRATEKMQVIDIHHEDNLTRGRDKYKTLRAIREGNTKKRVEQFECM